MFRVVWIGGWGVAPESLRPLADRFLPRAANSFLAPDDSAPGLAAGSDCVIAWSLGAWRVLDAAAEGLRFQGRVFLLAPFLSFCSEDNLGGRCSRTQVKFLRRWIQREPEAALSDFYNRAGLALPAQFPPCPPDVLLGGLDALEKGASPQLLRFAEEGLPSGWKAVIGQKDSLLDAEVVCRTLRGCVLVEDATHSLETLLPALEIVPNAV